MSQPVEPVAAVPEHKVVADAPARAEAEVEERALLALRVAGGLTILSALLGVALTALAPDPADAAMPGSIGALIFDVVVGVALLRGQAKWKPLAIFRLVAGLLLWGGMSVFQGDWVGLVLQAALSTSLLLLLIGKPGKARLRVGAALCGGVLLLMTAGLLGVRLLPAVAGDTYAAEGGVARGTEARYALQVPSSFRVRERAAMKADNAAADLWLVDSLRDAHVVVVCEQLEVDVPAAAYFDASIESASVGQGLRVDERRPPADGATSGRARLSGTPGGLAITYLVDTRTKGGTACTAFGFAPTTGFGAVETALTGMLDSFVLE